MNLTRKIAKLRLRYHLAMLDLGNVAFQLKLINKSKAAEILVEHSQIIANDILPWLGVDFSKEVEKG